MIVIVLDAFGARCMPLQSTTRKPYPSHWRSPTEKPLTKNGSEPVFFSTKFFFTVKLGIDVFGVFRSVGQQNLMYCELINKQFKYA